MIPAPRAGRPVLLDGAMGTALLARRLPAGWLPERWVVERPFEVAAVHASHVAAGARVVTTCTFNLARLDAAGSGLHAADVAARAVGLARAARPEAVAGGVGATGLAGPGPSGPTGAEFRERYGAAFRPLAAAGVHFLWAESQLALHEARAALAAGRATGLPVVVTAWIRPSPSGFVAADGTPAVELMEALWREGAAAVGVNCIAADASLARLVAAIVARVPVPVVAKPSAGLPGHRLAPAAFATEVAAAARAGATLVGGCCGSDPADLRAVAAAVAPAGPDRSAPDYALG